MREAGALGKTQLYDNERFHGHVYILVISRHLQEKIRLTQIFVTEHFAVAEKQDTQPVSKASIARERSFPKLLPQEDDWYDKDLLETQSETVSKNLHRQAIQ